MAEFTAIDNERTQSPNWDDIREIVRRLGHLSASSESEFIGIGAKLQTSWEAAAGLNQLGAQASEILSGPEMIRGVELLGDLIGRLGKFLEISGERLVDRIETIGRLRQDVDRAATLLSDMKKMVLELRMLGVSTRIESARLSSGIKDFTILAEEVNRQSGHIKSKSGEIRAGLSSLRIIIQDTAAKLNALNDRRKGRGNSILERISATLEIIKRLREASERSANRISEDTGKISRSMGEAVMAIQFHDITRQQIEHVVDALKPVSDDTAGELKQDICRLQAAQLVNARQEIVTAVVGIRNNLIDIASILRSLSAGSGEGSRDEDFQLGDFVAAVEENMSVAAASMDEYRKAAEDQDAALKIISETLESMSGFAHEVEAISQTIRLVALNAGIQAAGLGREGAVFGTIAQAIKDLSLEARRLTDTLAGALDEVTRTARSLLGGASESSDDTVRIAGELRLELDARVAEARKITSEAGRCRENLRAGSRALADEIARSAEGITVHERMSRELDAAIASLSALSGAGIGGDSTGSVDRKSRNFEDLANRYTMEAERKIHQSILNGEAEPCVETKRQDTAGAEDLGDNVELF